jgi:hypothetical protein
MSRVESKPRHSAENTAGSSSTDGARPTVEKSKAAKQPSVTIDHSAGSRQLTQGRESSRSSASVLAASVLVTEKRPDAPSRSAQPLPIDGYPGAKEVQRALLGDSPPPLPPLPPQPPPARESVGPKPKPKTPPARTESQAGGPQPPAHVAMREKYEALAAQYEKAARALPEAEKVWREIAEQRRQIQARDPRGLDEGLEGTAWYAERQAELVRDLRREIGEQFSALKTQYEIVSGQRKAAAIGPSTHTGARRAQSEVEILKERMDRYNRSIELLKSSGVIGAALSTAYIAAAMLNGRQLTDDDYRKLDALHSAAKVLAIPAAIEQARSGPSGAAPPAPGVDYRRSATLPTQPLRTPAEIRPTN